MRVETGNSFTDSALIEILPEPEIVNYWVNGTSDVQTAGEEINPIPVLWPLDRFGNLFDSTGLAHEWKVTYNGTGFLPCSEPDMTCTSMKERVKFQGMTSCFGASEPGYNPLKLNFRAPSMSRSHFFLWAQLLSPCLLYTSPSPRDVEESRMPSSA